MTIAIFSYSVMKNIQHDPFSRRKYNIIKYIFPFPRLSHHITLHRINFLAKGKIFSLCLKIDLIFLFWMWWIAFSFLCWVFLVCFFYISIHSINNILRKMVPTSICLLFKSLWRIVTFWGYFGYTCILYIV